LESFEVWGGAAVKVVLVAATIMVALSAPATAANLPVKAPPVATMAGYSWSGCYVGGNLGWVGGNERQDVYLSSTPPTTPAQSEASRNSYALRGSGFAGGGEAGCNIQIPGSIFVFGMEADVSGSSFTESASASYGNRVLGGGTTQNPHTETVSGGLDWYSTYRGRIGVAVDRWFTYATGGVAVGYVRSATDYFVTDTSFLFAIPRSQTRIGWTIGGGLEYALTNNWSAKVEYLYLDFGSFSYADNVFIAPTVGSDVHSVHDQVVRVGLNYKFNGPLMARY
jgi:outer membrane immunogenic protein